jgi:NADPH-dependent 2,4-dienoyl-CoA reductase/sulfur reductase-like enzyme
MHWAMQATGVSPETSLAAAAGLQLQERTKAVLVDAHMRTSDPAIYAVGDAVAAPSLLLGPAARMWLPLGGPANRQARVAADHIVTGAC